MRAAICDDRAEDARLFAQYVRAWAESRGGRAALEIFPSAEAFLFAYDEDKDFDLLLLDVEMGGMDGVTMARRVRAENASVQIVFITGYTDYIAEGYDVAALHYLVKPVREEKLFEVLDRAAAKLRADSRARPDRRGGDLRKAQRHGGRQDGDLHFAPALLLQVLRRDRRIRRRTARAAGRARGAFVRRGRRVCQTLERAGAVLPLTVRRGKKRAPHRKARLALRGGSCIFPGGVIT